MEGSESAMLQEIKGSPYIPWKKVHQYLSTAGCDDKVHDLIDVIEKATTSEIETLRQALTTYANNYQILVAKLQLDEIETQSEYIPDEEEDSEMNGMSLSKIFAEMSTQSDSDREDEISIQMDSDLSVSKCLSVTLYGTYADQESQTDQLQLEDNPDPQYKSILADLQYQNKKYLSLGLSWKQKCEAAERRMKNLAKEHAKEVQSLYDLLTKFNIKPASKQEQSSQ